MNKTKTFQTTSIVLALLIIGLLFGHYLIYQNIKVKNVSIAGLQNELSQQSDRQNYFSETEQRLKTLATEIGHIKGTIVPKGGEVSFIEEIETLARENGLSIEIDSIVVSADNKEESDVEILKIKAHTEGSWSGNYKFLHQIENLYTKVKIDRYAFVNKSKKESFSSPTITPMVWESVFEISVLRYK